MDSSVGVTFVDALENDNVFPGAALLRVMNVFDLNGSLSARAELRVLRDSTEDSVLDKNA